MNKKRIEKFEEKQAIRHSKRILNKEEPLIENEDLYFKSYENEEIHKEMLEDKVRMEAYEKAI